MKKALVATINADAGRSIGEILQSTFIIDHALTREDCLKTFRKEKYDFIFLDAGIVLVGKNGEELERNIQEFRLTFPSAEIIALCHQSGIRDAVRMVKAGVRNYLTYPVDSQEVLLVLDECKESQIVQGELDYLRDAFWKTESLELIRTNNDQMKKVFDKIRSVAPTKTTVLLTGETGVGKGVIARLLHLHSARSDNQFVAVHCGAIPDTLIESELFGHEKGAFTGADRRRLGKFEIVHGGTIFLDEVGTVTQAAQIKLLQVLQEKRFQRLGGDTVQETDVRIIAATNENLAGMSVDGRFRKDLYYRLSVFPIEIPPLRERKEDIPLMVDMFIKNLNRFHLKDIRGIGPMVMDALIQYNWPGNIRELENILERAYILERSSVLTPEGFPQEMFNTSSVDAAFSSDASMTLAEARRKAVNTAEKQYLSTLLKNHGGRIKKSAMAAGITTRQLHKLMTRYALKKEDFKVSIK